MEQSSSSKVTVEYHDPSGVFSLIARDLSSKLPLRNLNWQPKGRPLRQIKHLHVEFVPDAETQAVLRPVPPSRATDRPSSIDILRLGADAQKGLPKERRHQIPGLKTTPYLRIYILRCDDKNWYKQEERQKIKDWLRDVVRDDHSHENHDAFQWLIVHVVIPDTIAASEPRWRESKQDPDELKERSKGAGPKWTGKPKTVFDRLRADFNEAKSDHIAQIRLSKSQVSVDLLPVPAMARTLEETSDERDKSWADLMTKIRLALLTSFDLRVQRYEEDILEQESRQSLPGWNFCTFFIHKEGLARALESVGLLEDALIIYDELSLGLETIIVDLATGNAAQTATSFPSTGSEVVDRILGKGNTSSRRLFEKDYRDAIVRSTISVFDFFCYLFDRQTALILRLAGRLSSTNYESGVRESGDDLVMLSEICWRGLSFIHNAARSIKKDLMDTNKTLTAANVQSLVTSWTFSAADTVLERTHSSHLDLSDAGIKAPGKLANVRTESPRRAEFGFGMGADAHPTRNSSLPAKKISRAAELKSMTSTSSSDRISEDGFFSPPSSSGGDEIRPEIPGLAELGAYRAELVMLKRTMLEELASARGWRAGWASLPDFSSVDEASGEESGANSNDMIGSDAAACLSSQAAFHDEFEILTELAIRHFLSATHSKSAEKLMGDLAILKYRSGDLDAAADFFKHAYSLYNAMGWNQLDTSINTLHVECLSRLGRHSEALQSYASALTQSARAGILFARPKSPENVRTLPQLIERSAILTDPLTLPLLDFFNDLVTGHEIGSLDDCDGFRYSFTLQHTQRQDVTIDRAKVRLLSASDAKQEIILQSHIPINLTEGVVQINLDCNSTTLGSYLLDSIELHAGKIIFAHSLAPKPRTAPLALAQSEDAEEDLRPSILLFPNSHAFDMHIDLEQRSSLSSSRYISIALHSGWNDISSLNIRLNPASAGLRLHTTELRLEKINARADTSFKTGVIQLGGLVKDSQAIVYARCSIEQPKAMIHIKAEVEYRTQRGSFHYLTDVRLKAQLPVDVEVNDLFHSESLYSTFSVRPMDGNPLLLQAIALRGTKAISVQPAPIDVTPTVVLARQPADFAVVITKNDDRCQSKTDPKLELVIGCISASDIIKHVLLTALSDKLDQSDFGQYRRLLLAILTIRFRRAFDMADYERAMLVQETKTPSFADLGWFEVIDTLPVAQQRPLSDWLMKWHIECQRLPVTLADLPANLRRQYIIPVEVPAVDFVFQVALHATEAQLEDGAPKVGSSVSMRLQIASSTKWSQSSQAQDKAQDFVYDLQFADDVWLVGGRRRARITLSALSRTFVAPIILIPLNAGTHALPLVDIQPVQRSGDNETALTCETINEHAGQAIQVIHGRQRTTHVAHDAEVKH